MGELDDLREHMERYRAVTLQHFEILSEQDMAWRPRPDAFSCGQQLLPIFLGWRAPSVFPLTSSATPPSSSRP